MDNAALQALRLGRYEIEELGNPALLQEYEQKRNALNKKKHHHPQRNSDYWWTGKNSFKEVVDDIQNIEPNSLHRFFIRMHSVYLLACMAAVHPNGAGDSYRIGLELPRNIISTEASINGQESALFLATASFVQIGCVVCEKLHISTADYESSLCTLTMFYQNAMMHKQEGDTDA